MKLIGTEMLNEVIQTIIWSAAIRNTIPISVILIAPPGAGKSKTLLQYTGPNLHRSDDMTSAGLYDLLSTDRDNKLSHILLGDFNPVLSHKGSVTNLTVASMLSVMSDGVMEIKDGRRDGKISHRPIGFITAVTNPMYIKHMKHWQDIGLMRRFLPLFYNYSTDTKREAQKAISKGNITSEPLPGIAIELPDKQISPVIAKDHNTEIETLAISIGQTLGLRLRRKTMEGKITWEWILPEAEHVLPMSPQLVLQTLIRAHAAREHRAETNEVDIKFLRKIADFTNAARPMML